MEIDLTNCTEIDLFDLSQKISRELKDRPNRDKIKVYKVFVGFQFNRNFIKKENAVSFLIDNLQDDTIDIDGCDCNESPCKIGFVYIDKSGLQFCEDYI